MPYIPYSCPLIDKVIDAVDKTRSILDSVPSDEPLDDFARRNIEAELDGIHPAGRYGSSRMEEIRTINEQLRTRVDPYESKIEDLEARIKTLEDQIEEKDSEIDDLKESIRESDARIKELDGILNNVEQIIYE